MGYKGKKLGVFVLPERSTSRDTYRAMGDQRFKMRLLQSANNSIRSMSVAVNDVVKYDIENLKLGFN